MSRRRAAPVRPSDDQIIVIWGLAYLVVGVVLAAFAAWPVYQSPRMILVAAVGLLLGAGTIVLSRYLKWTGLTGALTTGLVAFVLYVVAVVPVAIPSAFSSPGAFFRGILDGLVGIVVGWKQLLTLDLPVGEYQAVLVPFFIVVFVGSIVASALITRENRWTPLAALAVLLMTVFGIAFGSSETSAPITVLGVEVPAPRELGLGVLSLLAAVVWLLGRARLTRARALARARAGTVRQGGESIAIAVRRYALAVGIVVIALVGGIVVAPAAASLGERGALRDTIDPHVVVQQQPSPLSGYRSWFQSTSFDTETFSITGDVDRVGRLPIAVLDEYDGEVFHVGADTRFSRLPRSAGPGSDRIDLDVQVGEGFGGIWVPAPTLLAAAPSFGGPRAEALADGFHIASDGGGAVDVAPTDDGHGLVPGDSYTVLADEPAPDTSFATATGGESTIDPELYPALTEWAALQELPRTGAGFEELIDRLRARGYLSHGLLEDDASSAWIAALSASGRYAFLSSYAGHSRARLETLFTSMIDQQRRAGPGADEDMLVSGVGDDEQFAAAAALLARHWGFESRVVVGVRLAGAEEVPGIPACDDACTGGSMSAWIEARPAGGEWTAIDATPQFAMLPTEITEGEQLPENPTVPDEVTSEAVDPPQAQSDSSDEEVVADDRPSEALDAFWPIMRWVLIGTGALLLLLLPFATLFFAKRIRRSVRRGSPDTEVRVVAAWEELVDLYTDYRIPLESTPSRILAAESSGRAAALSLAAGVDRAVFSEHPPAKKFAEWAWQLVDDERKQLAASAGFRGRVRAALSLRSFTRRAGSRPRVFSLPDVFRKEIAP
ncbi:hypothetical protein MN032_07070 [Agromyces atrinae]|uniref:transglutaminase domain-containing protein n=1 Tax=Agromyces atrinae TaxID=592376 RepID=UPI001F5652B0|nr:transglutaminase domain-containing protein [Agromyces atrinae]MCI2957446.1 hypothetical protein [Agromyces atrinae]